MRLSHLLRCTCLLLNREKRLINYTLLIFPPIVIHYRKARFWFGLRKNTATDEHYWSDGSQYSWENWLSDNEKAGQDYTIAGCQDFKWRDYSSSSFAFRYICSTGDNFRVKKKNTPTFLGSSQSTCYITPYSLLS